MFDRNAKFRVSTVSAVTGAPQSTIKKWIADGEAGKPEGMKLQEPQTGTWKIFSFADLISAVAIAEVSRAGLDPKQGRMVRYCLADQLHLIEDGERPREFIVGEVFGPPDMENDDESEREIINAFPCSSKDLGKHLSDRAGLSQTTTRVVIDVVGVSNRFHERLKLAIRGDK